MHGGAEGSGGPRGARNGNYKRHCSRCPLVSVTAYHSFGGEVEASNTPTIRRLTLHAVTNFRP